MLHALLSEKATEVRMAAAFTLIMLDEGRQHLSVLSEGLVNPEPHLRREAANYLAALGPLAKKALPALRITVNDPDSGVKWAAEAAIKKIGE